MKISKKSLTLLAFALSVLGCQTDPARQRWFDNKQTIRQMEDDIAEINKYPCEFGKRYKGGEFCSSTKMVALADQKLQMTHIYCIGVDHETAPQELIGQCYQESYIKDHQTNQKTDYQTEGNAEVLKWKK